MDFSQHLGIPSTRPGKRGWIKFCPMGALLISIILLPACSSSRSANSVPFEEGIPSQATVDSMPTPTASASLSPSNLAIPPQTTFQWQLSGPLDLSVEAAVFDIDLFETTTAQIDELHQQGRQVICYLSAGTLEDWRPDLQNFPAEVVGNRYPQWPDERWLDIRQIDQLAPALQARLDLAVEKGCDGIEPDNIDAYSQDNNTGFAITEADQIRFNRWLAGQAHKRGLSVGLKNVPDLAAALVPDFDWALTEDCAAAGQGWCDHMDPFISAGKAVFQTEYLDRQVDFDRVCVAAKDNRFTPILKNRNLDAFRQTCTL